MKLSPSILSADFTRLGDQVRRAEEAGGEYIHVDVMDGRFVPTYDRAVDCRGGATLHDAPTGRPPHDRRARALPGGVCECRRVDPDRTRGGVPSPAGNPCSHSGTLLGRASPSVPPPVGTLEEVTDDFDLVLVMTVNRGSEASR